MSTWETVLFLVGIFGGAGLIAVVAASFLGDHVSNRTRAVAAVLGVALLGVGTGVIVRADQRGDEACHAAGGTTVRGACIDRDSIIDVSRG